jgi:hypothetical protein
MDPSNITVRSWTSDRHGNMTVIRSPKFLNDVLLGAYQLREVSCSSIVNIMGDWN